MSQESHRGINKELESLDLSMNSESFVSDPGSVKSPLSQSHSHEEEDLMVFQNTADRTSNSGNSLEEEDPFLDTVLPRLPPNFVLKSPFVESNMSAKVFGSEAQVAIPIKQGINPDELCIKALSDQELNSDNETSEAIEDDFVQLKLGKYPREITRMGTNISCTIDAESGIRYNDPDFQNEEFQEIGNLFANILFD